MTPVKSIFLFLLLFSFFTTYSQSRAIDSLQEIITEAKNDIENNKALNSIAIEFARIDMAKAKTYLYRSIQLSTQLKNDILLSNAYSQMVTLQMNTGKKDSAQYYLQLLKVVAAGSVSDIVKGNFNLTLT